MPPKSKKSESKTRKKNAQRKKLLERNLLEKVVEKYKQHIEANKHDPTIPRNDIPPIDVPEKFIPSASINPSTPPHHISYNDISPLHSTDYSPYTNKDYVQPIRVPTHEKILPWGVPPLTPEEIIDYDLFTVNPEYTGGKKKRKTRKKK